MPAQADLAAATRAAPSSPRRHRAASPRPARRIGLDRQDGSLALDSQHRRTTFRVRLPFTQS
jgi:hypothetical protein